MRHFASILLLVMIGTAAAEDEVKLKNGDRLSGKITGLGGGKLTIETVETGPVKVDWAQVVSVKTDAPVKVTMTTGEIVEGKVVPGAEGRLKVETQGAAAPVEIDLAKVKAFNEPPAAWHGKLSASAKASDGNTKETSFLVSAAATRETDMDLLLFKAIFHYGTTGSTLTERNAYGIGKYQLKMSPEWYLYVSEELQGDTFKDLSIGTTTSVGAGVVILKQAAIDLSTEVGIAFFTNDFNVAPDETHMGIRSSTYLRVALPLGIDLRDNFTLYTNFEDSQDFQIRNELTLGTSLGGGWDLLGGVITEYDRKPSAGLERQDDTYFVGLGYTF
jgi:putative salt-induced outer membrane protein YdiY